MKDRNFGIVDVEIGDRHITAAWWFVRESRGGSIKLQVQQKENFRGPVTSSSTVNGEALCQAFQETDSRTIARFLEWVCVLDGRFQSNLLEGKVVSKSIPCEVPPALPSGVSGGDVDSYRSLRVPAGQLARPLLLGEPNLERLYDYQKNGVEWLLAHPKAILADDMGLGKTVQTIAAMQVMFRRGDVKQALIICPPSLLANWEAEITKWAPELTRLRLVPSASVRDRVWRLILGQIHVVITNYEQLRAEIPSLEAHTFDLVIADEVHQVRNLSADVTSGIRRLEWERFWGLTGTPIERDPRDLATLLSTLEPSKFSPSDANLPASSLRARAREYILRRRKSDVLSELPDVIETVEIVDLSASQRESYAAVERRLRGDLSDSDAVLGVFNKLRTICDYDPDTGESSKADRIEELLEEIALMGEKAVVFSYLVKPLTLLRQRLERTGAGCELLIGEMEIRERERAIARFKGEEGITALLATTGVAGEGLTLTEANHVIFFNEWWNPSSNRQARDRVVRIGQDRVVQVTKLRTRDTIEERLASILEKKDTTFDDLVERLAVDPSLLSSGTG